MPQQVRDEITFHIAESVDDVLGWALEPKATDQTSEIAAA